MPRPVRGRLVQSVGRQTDGQPGHRGVARARERGVQRHRAEIEVVVVGDLAALDVFGTRAGPERCRAPPDRFAVPRRPSRSSTSTPVGTGRSTRWGPVRRRGAFWATANTSPVDGWSATIAAAWDQPGERPLGRALHVDVQGGRDVARRGGSWPATRWTPAAVSAFTAQPAASSVRCCHRSDNPDSVGDAKFCPSRAGASAAPAHSGVAASRASIGARSSARRVIAVTGCPSATAGPAERAPR